MVRLCTWVWIGSALIALLGMTGWVRAEEPVTPFLEALRQREYYDAALLYLDRIEGSPLVAGPFQQRIAYERGLTLVQAAGQERDPAAREAKLQKARENLEQFVQQHPEHADAVAAQRQLGQLLYAWAKIKMDEAQRQGNAVARQDAARLYQEAYDTFRVARDNLKALLTQLGSGASITDSEQLERVKQLQNEYLEAQVLAGQMLEERAATFDEGSDQRKQLLEQAAAQYAEIYTKYGDKNMLAAYFARFYQARTLLQLGQADQALEFLVDDVLSKDENRPSFRALKTQAMLLACDAWMKDSKNGKAFEQGLPMVAAWLGSIRPAEATESEWVQLRWKLARMYKAYADLLKARNPKDAQISDLLDQATEQARVVSRQPGAYQNPARALLAELPRGIRVAENPEKPDPKTFEDARSAGQQALATMRSAQFILEHVPQRLAQEQDPAQKKELEAAMRDARATIEQRQGEAIDYFTRAVQLVDKETPLEDLGYVFYSLAYLQYMHGEYYDAVVLGEFLGRRHPETLLASKSAEIALGALLKLYEQNETEDRQFETDHIVALAHCIVDTWTGKPEAGTAINTLIPFLIRQGKIDEARQYVLNIPENSPERGSAELRVGQAMWQQYLDGMQELRAWEQALQDPDTEDAPALTAKIAERKPVLDGLKQAAVQTLEAGIERMRGSGQIDLNVVLAVLTLTQIYADSDQPAKALALIDDERIGPLALLKRKHAVMQDPRLVEQAYRLALGAVVGSLPKAADDAGRRQLMSRARQTMEALKQEVGDSPEGQKRLVGIFFSMARDLQRQLTLLDQPQARQVLSDGFAVFLDQVRSEASDVRVLNWVAQSYVGLGDEVGTDSESAATARKYYAQAVTTYDRILSDNNLQASLRRQLQVSKAIALRQAGKYADAVKLFEEVLAVDKLKVPIQVEAAKTLQLWAAEPNRADRYLDAVRGLTRNNQPGDLWGWRALANKTQGHASFQDTFHESRFSMAFCYFKYAMRQTDRGRRSKYLELASKSIVYTEQFFPDLGGKVWRTKYDALLKQIQRALEQPVVGLSKASQKRNK